MEPSYTKDIEQILNTGKNVGFINQVNDQLNLVTVAAKQYWLRIRVADW